MPDGTMHLVPPRRALRFVPAGTPNGERNTTTWRAGPDGDDRRGRNGPPAVSIWSPAQLGSFLDFAVTDRLGALYEVIALTGLRHGEPCGLRWPDLDLRRATLFPHPGPSRGTSRPKHAHDPSLARRRADNTGVSHPGAREWERQARGGRS
jgi:integrase